MIVYCKECNTGFNLDEKMIKPTGSKVRCSNCKSVFLAYPPQNEPDDLVKNIGIDISGFNSDESSDGFEDAFKDMTLVLDKQLKEDETRDVASIENSSEDEEDLKLELDGDILNEVDADPSDLDESVEDSSVLDLSDLENMLEVVDESGVQKVSEDEPEDITLELDMDLEAEEAGDFDIAVTDSEDVSELDLSDIEDMLEIEEDKENLKFELDDEVDELESDQADLGEAIEDTAELDLSDIEDMLEIVDESGVQNISEDDSEDLTLELDMDLEAEEAEDFDIAVTDSEDVSGFDLSDIEDILEIEEDSVPSENSSEEDLKLELDGEIPDELESDQTDLGEAVENSSELDLSDIEDVFEIEEDSVASETSEEDEEDVNFEIDGEIDEVEADDSELESVIEDVKFEDDLDNDLVEEVVEEVSSMDESMVMGTEKETLQSITKDKKSKKSGRKTSRFFIVLFILVLFTGGLYFGSGLLEDQGIKLPYITDISIFFKSNFESIAKKGIKSSFIDTLFGKKVQQDPAGVVKLYPLESTIQGIYLDNSSAGTLYVINGEIKNNYDHPRSFISVTANIFTKGDSAVRMSKTVFCGNVFSHLELENLGLNAIALRLLNKEGYNKSNLNIKPGATVPFMVIFNDLPEDLEQFNIQPAGSFP